MRYQTLFIALGVVPNLRKQVGIQKGSFGQRHRWADNAYCGEVMGKSVGNS
jgi:hypothetical protein